MSIIGNVCQKALQDYIDNPWIWLRETSDLVSHLVQEIKTELIAAGKPLHVPAEIIYASPSLTTSYKPNVCRVRTEVKIDTSSKKTKTDICLLKEEKTTVNIMSNGIRDATLLIAPTDADELLEVKLAPHHSIEKSTTGWLSDLIKLSTLASWMESEKHPLPKLHLLSIDSGLPVGNMFQLANEPKQNNKSKIPWHLTCHWPLYAGQNYEITVPGKKIKLLWCKNKKKPALLLWALACEGQDQSRNPIEINIKDINEDNIENHLHQNFDKKNQYKPLTGITAGCWEVQVI